jgi:hypothetical protein
VSLIAYLVVFRGFVIRNGYVLPPLAIVLFGLSDVLDYYRSFLALDDVPKLFAIATWATFFVGASIRELQAVMEASVTQPVAVSESPPEEPKVTGARPLRGGLRL